MEQSVRVRFPLRAPSEESEQKKFTFFVPNERGAVASEAGVAPSRRRTKLTSSRPREYAKINSNSLISISGRYYVTADQYAIDDSHRPYQIYFDGEEFYLRHKDGSHKLIAAAMQGEQNLCFESQFPYSRSIYNEDTKIPD